MNAESGRKVLGGNTIKEIRKWNDGLPSSVSCIVYNLENQLVACDVPGKEDHFSFFRRALYRIWFLEPSLYNNATSNHAICHIVTYSRQKKNYVQ